MPSPLQKFYHWEATQPDAVFLRQPLDGAWHTMSWREAGVQVRGMAAYLKSLGLPPGSKVAILSKNMNYWILADLAIMMGGYVSVPMYPNLTAKTVRQILEHSEAKVCFVGKLDNFEAMRPGIPSDVYGITFPIYSQTGYDNWADLVNKQAPLQEVVAQNADDLMTIIYTSGTTGDPKGVMHKVGNFTFATENALKLFEDLGTDSKFFSYLPLCHIAERMVVEMVTLYTGGNVSFAESLDTFAKNLQETQPSVFLGVPRIWTKFQMAILEKLPQRKLNLLLSLPIVSNILKKKIRKGLGLSQAKYALTGAAPIAPSLMEWYKKLGILIQEGYAMTENCAYSHFTRRGDLRFGTVGQALPLNEVRIAEDGEIQTRCACILDGYYKNPELTAETITADGFLRTGDTGTIDKDGFLSITGRVKEIFKTAKGKYVAPSPIELLLSQNTYLEQVCVTGASLPQPIALGVLSAAAKELPREEVLDSLRDTLQAVNGVIDPHERLNSLVVLAEEWTVENNLLTPTLKIKQIGRAHV